jgi:hypothetical protein
MNPWALQQLRIKLKREFGNLIAAAVTFESYPWI